MAHHLHSSSPVGNHAHEYDPEQSAGSSTDAQWECVAALSDKSHHAVPSPPTNDRLDTNGGILTRSRERSNSHANSGGMYTTSSPPRSIPMKTNHQHRPDSSMQEGKRLEALCSMQTSLTAAMEQMEQAQLDFFHVERAFVHERARRDEVSAANAPWSVKVHFYCEFWQKFMTQLQTILGVSGEEEEGHDGDGRNNHSLDALNLLASNIWGETRASAQEIFQHGPIVLASRRHYSRGEEVRPMQKNTADVHGRPPAQRRAPEWGSSSAVAINNRSEAVAGGGGAEKPRGRARKKAKTATTSSGAKQRLLSASGGPGSFSSSTTTTERSPTATSFDVVEPPDRMHLPTIGARKKRSSVRASSGRGDGGSSDGVNTSEAAVELTSADRSGEAIREIKDEVVEDGENAKVLTSLSVPSRSTNRTSVYEKFPELQQRIHEKLENEDERNAWPNLRLPFPRQSLFFDSKKYPQLAEHHEKVWQSGISSYLEVLYFHPSSIPDRGRIAQLKMGLFRRQVNLLSKYIEILGVHEVARSLLVKKEASFAFFFVKKFVSLECLSSEQLELHLKYLKEPWKSPITHEYQVSWWDTLIRKKNVNNAGLQEIVLLSDTAKELVANAHFDRRLAFDDKWMQLSKQSPWKTMLEEYRVSTEKRQVVRRGKRSVAKPLIKQEERATTSPVAATQPSEKLRWLHQLATHLSDATGSDNGSDDAGDANANASGSEQRPKLGKRLRTSKR